MKREPAQGLTGPARVLPQSGAVTALSRLSLSLAVSVWKPSEVVSDGCPVGGSEGNWELPSLIAVGARPRLIAVL